MYHVQFLTLLQGDQKRRKQSKRLLHSKKVHFWGNLKSQLNKHVFQRKIG